MQMNDIVGLVQIGARRPKSKRVPNATRPMRESRAEQRQSADAPRRREADAETTRLPPQYGAGF